MWVLYAVLAAIFAAATAILAKVGIKGIDSNLATAIRTVVILVITWGTAWATGALSHIGTLTRTNYLALLASGIATGLSWLFYFKALQLGKVSQVAPVDKLSVALAIVFGMVFLGESPDPKVIIGGILIVLGSVVIIW